MDSSASSALKGCVSSLRTSMQLLESSINILDTGVNDYPRLTKVLQTTRVCSNQSTSIQFSQIIVKRNLPSNNLFSNSTSNSSPNPPSKPPNKPSSPPSNPNSTPSSPASKRTSTKWRAANSRSRPKQNCKKAGCQIPIKVAGKAPHRDRVRPVLVLVLAQEG